MRVDCNNCYGSGGGPEAALRCTTCRGRGYREDEDAHPCDHCGEPGWDAQVGDAGWYCEECQSEFFTVCEECGDYAERHTDGSVELCPSCK